MKSFFCQGMTAVKMWETRIKYATKLSNEKRKMAGENINVYRRKKRKMNIVSTKTNVRKKVNSFKVYTKPLFPTRGEYKPKQLTRSAVQSDKSKSTNSEFIVVQEKREDRHISASMKHSVKASATYKPKRCIRLAKQSITRSTIRKKRSNQHSKTNFKHQKERIGRTHLCEHQEKHKKSKIVSSRKKRKFEKSFPPITNLIDGDRGKKKIRVGSTMKADGNKKLNSLKRKVEADTSLLRKYEKRRNYDFIKNRAGGQFDFRQS